MWVCRPPDNRLAHGGQTLARGIAFLLPEPFPAHSLASPRVGMVAEAEGWVGAFPGAAFAAWFAKRADIAAPEMLAHIVAEFGHDPARIMVRTHLDEVRSALRSRTEAAAEKGIFGAPTFLTEADELFWGDDRLAAALAWTSGSVNRIG
jgi:2-hydroxychromene-2-carboxylate isomerase